MRIQTCSAIRVSPCNEKLAKERRGEEFMSQYY